MGVKWRSETLMMRLILLPLFNFLRILMIQKIEQLIVQCVYMVTQIQNSGHSLDYFAYGSGSTLITKQHRDENGDRGKIIRLFDLLRIDLIRQGIHKIIMGIIWRLFTFQLNFFLILRCLRLP